MYSGFRQAAAAFGAVFNKMLTEDMAGVLEEIGEVVTVQVKDDIGNYLPSIGPYPPTAPLSPTTLAIKEEKGLGLGGNPDTPLWATGDFWGDVSHVVDASNLSVTIGTNKEYIVFTEFGTTKMPPRPVFGPAVLQSSEKIKAALKKGIVSSLTGVRAVGVAFGGGSGRGVIVP